MKLFLKILSGVANNADPDKTADLSLHCLYAILSETPVFEILGQFTYFQGKI